MRILLQTETETVRLAGEPEVSEREFSSAFDFRMSGQAETRIERRVRSAYAMPIDHGNLSRSISFGSARNFPTAQAAQDFATAYERNYPRSGEVIFQTASGSRKLTEAVVKPPSVKIFGTQAVFFYQVDGREVEPYEEAPPEPEIIIDGASGMLLRMRSDDTGEWFEAGFESPYNTLLGDAANGWTDPGGHLLFRLERSENLADWDFQWTDAPGSPVDNGDGTYTYWGRSTVPRLWKFVTVDLTATSNRYGKSLTHIELFGALISLPNYPYAMPADAATLQTDLIAAGYTGAVVDSTSASLSVEIINHVYVSNSYNRDVLPVTLSGTDVTMVKTSAGADISLPSYPYAMPADLATLQADLIAAGQTGANVRLFGDEWSIFIPNRDTILNERRLLITFTPADPHDQYTIFGDLEENPGNTVQGTSGNVRLTAGGGVVPEADKQFARVGISPGPNYQYTP